MLSRLGGSYGRHIPYDDLHSNTTRYTYNLNNQLTSVETPMGYTEELKYNLDGKLETNTNPDGRQIQYDYDVLDQLVSKTAPSDGETGISAYGYDTDGNPVSMEDVTGTTDYEYDLAGRLTAVTTEQGGKISYGYDVYGNITSMTYPDGGRVSYAYDALNRMTSITGRDGKTTAYSYDANSNLTKVTRPNGTFTVMEYDAEGRILKLSNVKENGNIISDFAYTYDKSGYIIEEIARQDGQVVTTSYTYDSRGQLLSAYEVNSEYTQKVEYTYDNAGNRLTEKDSRTQWGSTHVVTDLVNTYDANDRLIKQTNKADSWIRSITYTYDENGNMVRKDTPDNSFTTYQYDSENRLTAVQDGGALLFAALYDGNGDRVFTVAPRQNTGNWHDDWNDGRWAVAEPQNGYNDSQWVYGEDETEETEPTEATEPTTAPTEPTQPTEVTEPATEPTKPAETTAPTRPSGEDDGSWWEGKYEGGNTGVDDGHWNPDGTTKPTEATEATEPTETQPEPTNPDTSGIPAWDQDTVYLGGDKVIYNGNVYEARWWTLGDVPGHVNEGPWKLVGEATQPTDPEETEPEETEPEVTEPATVPTEPKVTASEVTEPEETETTEPVETFPVGGSANYDLGMIRDILFVPNGIDTAYEEENYVLTGYINNINTQYTQVLAEFGNSGAYTSVYEYGVQRISMYQNGQVYSYEYDGRGSVSELVNAIGDTQIKYSYGAYGETVSTVIGWNNPVTNPYRYNAERIDDVAGVPAFQYLRARYLNPYTATFLTQDSYLGSLLILIFSVLLISFSSAIVALSLVGSISKTNAEFRLNTYGEWYCGIPSGMEEDAQWLENQQWAKAIGKAGNYGTIHTAAGQTGFGTLDNSLVSIGRIKLDEGTFPMSDDEIAMEADALSALGCDYELGQEITLLIEVPYQDQLIPVERSYILCGVMHEYSNLWVLNRNADNRLLVSAVVTEAAAEAVLEAARECITGPENRELVIPIPQYFLAVEEADRETACHSINGWLSSTRTGDFGDIRVCENTAAYPDAVSRDYDDFYVYIIAAVTMTAVLCVYIMQMSGEIHRFAVLRSIGITKPQMTLLLLMETLILILPAIALGIPCGAGLTWLALRGMLYSGSVAIQVAIPYDTLLAVIGLWVAAVLLSRLIMFALTVHTPLTGRMRLQGGKSRRVKRLRSALIILLLCAFGAVTIYTGMESIRPNYLREYWSLCPAYTIWEDATVSVTKTNLIKQVPGVIRVDGFGEMEIGLSFDRMEEQTVWIYAIDEEGWTETFDFSQIKEDFHNGELVILCFPENSGEEYTTPEGKITLRVYSNSGECLVEAKTDARIVKLPENGMNRGLSALWEPYTIFCSESFLKQLLASMEEGQRWDKYIAGEEFGYNRVYVGVDLNSDYLSTDVAMADLCKENELTFDNRRQQFQSLVQENVQTLILLYGSGICIALVVLLILASAVSLEAEQEKRHFGILQAIGMSKRQMGRKLFTKALMRSLTAVVLGWVLYGGYLIIERMIAYPTDCSNSMEALASAVQSLIIHGCDLRSVLLTSGICLFIPLTISLLAKRKLMKGDLAL